VLLHGLRDSARPLAYLVLVRAGIAIQTAETTPAFLAASDALTRRKLLPAVRTNILIPTAEEMLFQFSHKAMNEPRRPAIVGRKFPKSSSGLAQWLEWLQI
jgi:hypothetical protein